MRVVDVRGILGDALMWSAMGCPSQLTTAKYVLQQHDHLAALALAAESVLAAHTKDTFTGSSSKQQQGYSTTALQPSADASIQRATTIATPSTQASTVAPQVVQPSAISPASPVDLQPTVSMESTPRTTVASLMLSVPGGREHEDLLDLPCVQFNHLVRLRGLSAEAIAQLKQARLASAERNRIIVIQFFFPVFFH